MDKIKVIEDINALFKQRMECYNFFDKNLNKIKGTEAFDFNENKALDAKEVYTQFYHFDYAIRKLMPAIFKAYEIDPNKDLN